MKSIRLRSPDPRRHDHPDEPYLSRLTGQLPPLVFIMGDHRSGTTVLYQSLIETGAFDYTSAYHIIAAAELLRNRIEGTEASARAALQADFDQYVGSDRIIDGIEASPDTPEEFGFVLQNAGAGRYLNPKSLPYFRQFVEKMAFLSDGTRPLLLKSPWDFGSFVPIYEMFPTAKFVFIHRDPESLVNSKLRALEALMKRPGQYMIRLSRDYARLTRHPLLFRLVRWMIASPGMIPQMVRQSQQYADYYFRNIAKIPESQRVEMTYHSLCAAPNETIERVLNTVGVTPHEPLRLDEKIKPRKLQLDPRVAAKKSMMQSRLSRYVEFQRSLEESLLPHAAEMAS